MMSRMLNAMRLEGERAAGSRALPRRGTITAYDPSRYAAKVKIQPEGFETGFLPIGAEFVGNGWGFFLGPSIGDEVEINFQEGGKNAAYIGKRFFGDQARPLPVPSGELWAVHKSGTTFKFLNTGDVTLFAARDLTLQAGRNIDISAPGFITVSAPELDINAETFIDGNLTVSDDIFDQGGGRGSVQNIRDVYDSHTHGGIQGGTGDTAVPNQPL